MTLYKVNVAVRDGLQNCLDVKFVFAEDSIKASQLVLDYFEKEQIEAHTISVMSVNIQEGLIFDSSPNCYQMMAKEQLRY